MLTPVRDALTELERPRSLLSNWHKLASLRLLTDIAQGHLELSHDALDAGATSTLPARSSITSPQAGTTWTDCPQDRLDAWITTDRGRRLSFIRWLKRGGYLPLIRLPDSVPRKDPHHEVDPDEQIALGCRLLHESDSASIEDRAAACLILLYARPAAKIVTLTTDDIEISDGETAPAAEADDVPS